MQLRERTTRADFEAFLAEAGDDIYEFIDGEIVAVPSNPFASELANLISFFIRMFLRENGIQGHVTGADGGYVVNGQVFAPDVDFTRTPPPKKGFAQTPPALAVEVISDPTHSAEQTTLRRKLYHYQKAGVVVWVVDYAERVVDVHVPGEPPALYDATMALPGGDVLPGFALPISDILPQDADRAE